LLLFVFFTNVAVWSATIKQYDSTVKVGIGAIVAPAAKNATSKNHPIKTFYATKTTFTE